MQTLSHTFILSFAALWLPASASTTSSLSPGTRSSPSVCSVSPIVGPCKAILERYFYKETSGRCEKFYFGGCKGNGNNFETESTCNDTCGINLENADGSRVKTIDFETKFEDWEAIDLGEH